MSKLFDDLEFQVAASSCLANFNQIQFALLDAVVSSAYYKYNETSKAIIHLVYESIFDWNMLVLRELKQQPLNMIDQKRAQFLIDELKSNLPKTVVSLRTRYGVREASAVTLYMILCGKYVQVIAPVLQDIFNNGSINAYREVNNFLISAMDHVYRVANELDYIVYGDKSPAAFDPFLAVDKLDLRVYELTGVSMPEVRLEIYREAKLFRDQTVSVKSYIDSQYLETNSHLNSLWESMLDTIERSGVKIICII